MKLNDGWMYELMLTLYDFYKTKRSVHKFYEAARPEHASGLLQPIFPVE